MAQSASKNVVERVMWYGALHAFLRDNPEITDMKQFYLPGIGETAAEVAHLPIIRLMKAYTLNIKAGK